MTGGARFRFIRRAGKTDLLELLRADGRVERLDCPKQGIIPHDMVHIAVEVELGARGFVRRVAAGEAADVRMTGDAESDGVERLVEVMQADGWSGPGAPAEALIALYRVTCEARGCPMLPVDADAIEAVRARIADLSRRWDAVPVGGALELDAP